MKQLSSDSISGFSIPDIENIDAITATISKLPRDYRLLLVGQAMALEAIGFGESTCKADALPLLSSVGGG